MKTGKKVEAKEQTMSDSSGAFEAPMSSPVIRKKDITKIKNSEPAMEVQEVTDSSSSGQYDVPLFGGTKGRKNPLKIDGPSSIGKSRAVKDKNFPKFGGPGGVFVKIKDKCKKFPYCNQGDINAIEVLKEAMEISSKKYGLPKEEVEKIVLKGIREIFI